MNGMNFKPFISKLLNSLSDEQLGNFAKLIDSYSGSFTNRSLIDANNLLTTNDKGIGLFTIQLDRETIRTGYLVYNDDYCVLLSYVSNSERVMEYEIDMTHKTYKAVKEFLTTDYLRHEVAVKAINVGEAVTVQADDIESPEVPFGHVIMADGDGGAEWTDINLVGGTGEHAVRQYPVVDLESFQFSNPNSSHNDDFVGIDAAGEYSSMFGGKSRATGKRAHAEGTQTIAEGNYSHTEGNNTTTTPVAHNGHAEGLQTTVSGSSAHAEGKETVASGSFSHAEGWQSVASGGDAHAEGYQTTASGDASHSEGAYSKAAGEASHSEGVNNYVGVKQNSQPGTGGGTSPSNPGTTPNAGDGAHAEGRDNYCYGHSAHVEGVQNVVNGTGAHAEGLKSTATGNYSHAEGSETVSDGLYAHAEGYKSSASANYAHAEGNSTKATGNQSHAEGNNTTASGSVSHAEGTSCKAEGAYSHSGGRSSTVTSASEGGFAHGREIYLNQPYQTGFGQFNEVDAAAKFMVGDGTADSARKNAFSVRKNATSGEYSIKVGSVEITESQLTALLSLLN